MSTRARLVVAMLWIVSLVAVAAVAGDQKVPAGSSGEIVSGGDIGFRVESMQGHIPVGTLVIRWKGQWIEPAMTKKIVPITR